FLPSIPLTPLFLTSISSTSVLVFWLHRILLLLPLSRGFRSVSLSVCLVTHSTRSVGRCISHTFLISRMLTKMQVAIAPSPLL
ncbi:hypothetical protein GQ42DRAFT_164476, partial [Ramicandelaber brevisporus]